MKYKYIIEVGHDRFNSSAESFKASEILEGWEYDMSCSETLLETSSKKEALAKLDELRCKASVHKTNVGFEWCVEIVQLSEIVLEEYYDDYFEEMTDEITEETVIGIAKFERDEYSYEGCDNGC